MKQFNRARGRRAEGIAADHLQSKGYEILQQNFANKYGEIDVIAKDGETVVFVEVKAKTGDDFGTPEEMVGKGKLSRVKNMASIYLEGKSVPCRVDVVAIVFSEEGVVLRLTHYENVY